MSNDADKAYALRLPLWLYKEIEKLAQRDMRSVNNMLNVLLREAVAARGMGQSAVADGDGKQPAPVRAAE